MTCTLCGDVRVRAKRETVPFFQSCGILVQNTPVYYCTTCGERMVTFEHQDALSTFVAQLLGSKGDPLTGAEVAFLRCHFGWTNEELADVLDVTPAAVAAIEAAAASPCRASNRLQVLLRPLAYYSTDAGTVGQNDEMGSLAAVLRYDGRSWRVTP
jgi:HTH-type transcriptional regulator/antitoxin MqsA